MCLNKHCGLLMVGRMPRQLLYLSDSDVRQFLPEPLEAVRLANEALRAIASGAAILRHDAIRPVPETGFSAIYGALRQDGSWIAGQKWVSEAVAGIAATLLISDGATGELHTIMDARNLTGLRTAAVSGACIAALGRQGPVALVGTGLQCRWHLRILEALGWREVRLTFRRRESGQSVVAWAREHVPLIEIELADSAQQALRGAPVVITMVTRGARGADIPASWLAPDALVLPVDFADCIGAEAAAAAATLAADDPVHYGHARADGRLPGYPPAHRSTGEVLSKPPSGGLIVIQNLGNSAADLAIGSKVREAAEEAGAGMSLRTGD